MDFTEEEYNNSLAHYGTKRHSGRYPWGSGQHPNQHGSGDFISTVEAMRKQGMSEVEIARGLGMKSGELRERLSNAKTERTADRQAQAAKLQAKGYSNGKIAEIMGLAGESSVRALLKPATKDKLDILKATTGILRDSVDKGHYIDIGSGVEQHMGITADKLRRAVRQLQDEEGYTVHKVKVDQLGTGHQTTVKVLAAPGTEWKEVQNNQSNIKMAMGYSDDGGRSFVKTQPPLSFSSKRLGIRYAEDGGAAADGVIYVRPGVKDVSLGSSHYAQVRILVDGTHYIKGMAMYKEGLPEGHDLVFNTNKHDTGNKLDALKPVQKDPTNPFGAEINHQIGDKQHDGTMKLTSVMNLVNKEGDWEKWSKNLSSQFLSKQSRHLIKSQLDLAYQSKKNELDRIMGLTNPVVRQVLLQKYSEGADSAAVNLKAAALPRQGTHVILPIDSMRENEVYAPNYNHGERVVLIRHPHGGIFEIPELVVNNKHPEASRLLDQARDAIGIHSKVAEKLSGADFDGDTVLVIPNNDHKIKTAPILEGLKGFDPKSYKLPEHAPKMSAETKGLQMGLVSNLITDMTLKGAPLSEIVHAVKHSMVVIDAEKHHLDYKRSAADHGIPALMKKYQGNSQGGAATLISRAKSPADVYERKTHIDRATGAYVHEYTGRTYVKRTVKMVAEKDEHGRKTGNKVPALDEHGNKVIVEKTVPVMKSKASTKLAETDNAHTLSSGTVQEKLYADHSNRLKNLANIARKEMLATKGLVYSPTAAKTYHEEVKKLEADLHLALMNSPLERQAQIIAAQIVKAKVNAAPNGVDKAELKKIRSRALNEARSRTGASKPHIEISDKQWEAIQAGAITSSRLRQILLNANTERVKELATPKEHKGMSEAQKSRAVTMLADGYSRAAVAQALGVSVSTLKRELAGSGD